MKKRIKANLKLRNYLVLITAVLFMFLPSAVFAVWDIYTIDNEGDVGAYSSIARDSSDKVHISYYDISYGNLKYATNALGSWVVSIIDSTGDVGGYSSIAIDSSDKVHISYYEANKYYNDTQDLKYATNALGTWVIQTG